MYRLYRNLQIKLSTLSAASLASFSMASSLLIFSVRLSPTSCFFRDMLPLVRRRRVNDFPSSDRQWAITSSYTPSTKSCSLSPTSVGAEKSMIKLGSLSDECCDLRSSAELVVGQAPLMTSLAILSITLSGRPAHSSRMDARIAFGRDFCTSADRMGRLTV